MVAGKDPILEFKGGHGTYVRAYARAACRAGYAPELFCMGRAGPPIESEYGRIHRVPTPFSAWGRGEPPSVRSRNAFYHVPLLCRAIHRFLRDETGPVLIHGFGVWSAAGARVAEARRRRGLPTRCVANCYTVYREEYRSKYEGAVRGYGLWRAWPYRLAWHLCATIFAIHERDACLKPDRLLVNYDSVRRFLEKTFGPVPHLGRIPYAAELAFLPEERASRDDPDPVRHLVPAEAPLIVSVSRHDPRKGMDILLRALALLHQRRIPFRACLTSAGSMYEANRLLARRLGLPENQVALPGYVPEVRSYLRAADIFCLPSLEEHSGSVSLLEALQAGRATVATAIDGIPEDVTHDEQAWLVPAGDPAALAAGLERLLTSPDVRRRLGAAARARFQERFSADAVVAALRDLYVSEGRRMTPA